MRRLDSIPESMDMNLSKFQEMMEDRKASWTAAHQASLSSTTFLSLLKFTSIESLMLSNHLTLTPSSPAALNLSQHQGLFQ